MATKLFSGVDASKNPFTSSTVVANPFATNEVATEQRGATGYALVTSGPAVDPSEVENAAQSSVEVSISWGVTMLHVEHLSPARSFVVGDEDGNDFSLPASKLGQSAATLVAVEEGQTFVVLLAGAKGHMDLPGVGRVSLDEARTRGQAWGGAGGAVRVALPAGARVRQEVGDLVLQVGSVAAGKRSRRTLFGAASATALLFAGLSMVGHLSVLGGLAFMQPSLGAADDEDSRRDQLLLMQQFLKASAERNEEKVEEPTATPDTGAGSGSGAMAKGDSGTMGSTTSKNTSGRFAVQARTENAPREIGREQLRQEAANFGMIGLLQAQPGGDRGPVAPWGAELANGSDAFSASGNMWGASLDEAAGSGGLGLHGPGSGGGGLYEGIGIGTIATIGGGSGNCKNGPCNGIGNSTGRPLGVHQATSISIRTAPVTVSGRLPAEIIQRIVRQSFGRFRLCYENGLRSNPNLAGRVAVRFVIDRSGAVSSTSNGGSDLPDSAVVGCVVRSFSGLSFPQPENGIVSVTYPITFAPGSN